METEPREIILTAQARPLCEWYAGCVRFAQYLIGHPILPDVPTCDACMTKHQMGARITAIYCEPALIGTPVTPVTVGGQA